MKIPALFAVALAPLLGSCGAPPSSPGDGRRAMDAVDTVVVIYAENRSFDTFYSFFRGANGIRGLNPSAVGSVLPQRGVDGAVLPVLPPVWGGLTAPGQSQVVTQAQTAGLGNRPFQIDGDGNGLDGHGIAVPTSVTTRDRVHRFYNNVMQIDGGRNDRFAAYSDAGGLSMGYHGSRMALWSGARQYTLADNFFIGTFGGSFPNHPYLVCACLPEYPHADKSPAKSQISDVEVNAEGNFVRFLPAANGSGSALVGPQLFRHDGSLTARDGEGKYYAVNTMQPPYQPSGNEPAAGGAPRFADAGNATTMPPLALPTIGDRLDPKGVSWASHSGAWKAASAGTPQARSIIYKGKTYFVAHHQPFNYFTSFDPATRAAYRSEHLRDFDSRFLADAAAGRLPAVTFYKPQGNLNQHAGYANVADGDAHIAALIASCNRVRNGRTC